MLHPHVLVRRPLKNNEWLDERRGNRRLRYHVQTTHEILMGGPKDFREQQIEKRKQRTEPVHGASRDKHWQVNDRHKCDEKKCVKLGWKTFKEKSENVRKTC